MASNFVVYNPDWPDNDNTSELAVVDSWPSPPVVDYEPGHSFKDLIEKLYHLIPRLQPTVQDEVASPLLERWLPWASWHPPFLNIFHFLGPAMVQHLWRRIMRDWPSCVLTRSCLHMYLRWSGQLKHLPSMGNFTSCYELQTCMCLFQWWRSEE